MTRRSVLGPHLYSQIVVPLIVAAVTLAVVASLIAVYFLRDLTGKWVSQVAESTATGVVDRYRAYTQQMRDLARIAGNSSSLSAAVDSGRVPRLRSELSSVTVNLGRTTASVLDASGAVVAAVGPSASALGSRPLSDVVMPQTGDASSATLVHGLDGRLAVTVLQPMLGTSSPHTLALTRPIDDGLLTYLAGGAGGSVCFYTTDLKSVACAISPSVPQDERAKLTQALVRPGAGLQSALRSELVGSPQASSLVIGSSNYRLLVRPVRADGGHGTQADGYIVGAIDQTVIERAARTTMNSIFVWSAIVVLVLVALGFWIARRVSDPLVELADGARRIADGDFSTKVEVRGDNEITRLGETFNEMTDSLKERSESLTKKVLELATLYEMSRALGSTLDMDDLLGSVLDSALRIFDLDVGYVALRERSSGALEIRAVRGGELAEPSGTEAVRSSMAEWVVREGRPLIFNPDSGSTVGQIDALTGAKAALCVPLVSSEGTIGAITVGSSDMAYRFNSEDVRLLSTIGNHVTIAIGNIELFTSLQEAYLATVRSLAAAVDAKDTYTRGHSDKVATYSILIAERLGMSHDQKTALEMAAYLHDIGKIGVPEEILLKPGALTAVEAAQMRHHPLIGANILKPVAFPWAITPIVRHHHERWDGEGYPAGLKGEEIPILARILCVADGYEAMTADRPYREGRTAAEAMEELHRCSGSQFDPRVVHAMHGIIEELERTGPGVLGEPAEEVGAEEGRAIFTALVDGVLASFRRLGGPRLASNVETEVDAFFHSEQMPFRVTRSRLVFSEDLSTDVPVELEQMRVALRRLDAVIGRVSGYTLVDHFYDDALDGLSARMRRLAVTLEFHTEDRRSPYTQ